MTSSAVPDVITIIGTAYLQPIADLLEKLLKKPISGVGPGGTSGHENGYSAAVIVLLVAVLESYTSRVRFLRRNESTAGSLGTPELLATYFPSLPTRSELVEVCLVRNVLAHNHVWHLDVSDYEQAGAPTLATPRELGFQTNKHYESVVDVPTRKTRTLGLSVNPACVDRSDVRKVFRVVWSTLVFMNTEDFRQTPLAGWTVAFCGKRQDFAALADRITDEGLAPGSYNGAS